MRHEFEQDVDWNVLALACTISWLLGRSPKTEFLASRSIKIGLRISVCWFPGPEGRVLEVLVFLALRYATTCRQTTIKQVIPDSGNTIIEVSYHGPLVCGKAILQISAASVLWSCSRRTLSENSTKTEHIPQHYKVTDTHQILTRHCFGCRSVSCPSAIIQPSIVGDGNVLEDSSRSNISELKVPTRSRTPLNHHDINRMRRYPKPLPNPKPRHPQERLSP